MLRTIASAYEDFQTVRIANKGRIRDVIRKKLEGIKFNEVEAKKEEKDYSKKYKDDKLIKLWNLAYSQGKITKQEFNYTLKLWETAIEAQNLEKRFKSMMLKVIKTEPVYKTLLSKIRGLGPILSCKLITYFGDCSQYETVSKLMAHTGNHVIDGKAPARKKGETINYNPKLRTFTYLIGESLMKLNKGFYRKTYDEEKDKQLKRVYPTSHLADNFNGYKPEDVNLNKGHARMRAMRKSRKIFLDHYWVCSRSLTGLSTDKNYVEGVLGHTHIVTWKGALGMEGCLQKKE